MQDLNNLNLLIINKIKFNIFMDNFNDDKTIDYMSSNFFDEAENFDYERKTRDKLSKKRVIQLNETEKNELMFHSINEKISKPISNRNRGFQMLKKMGYKEGQKLGLNDNGLKEPLLPNTGYSNREGIGTSFSKKKNSGTINNINHTTNGHLDSNLLSALHFKKINQIKYCIIKSLNLLSNLLEIKFPEQTKNYYTKRQVLEAQGDISNQLEDFVDNMMLMKEIIEKESIVVSEIELYFDYLKMTVEKFEKIKMKENIIIKLKEKIESNQHNQKTVCLDIIQCFNQIEGFLIQFNEIIINYINKNMHYCTHCNSQYNNFQEFLSTCTNCEYKEDEE